jgi:hypothetical protein
MRARNVRLTDVLVKLPHEGNAELADLVVRLALRVEVGTTLATTHVEAGKSILEDLLETQELEDGKVDSGVETETTFVGTESRVELHTVALVDLALALVVLPDNTELDDALGDGGNLEGFLVLGVLLEEGGGLKSGDELCELRSVFLQVIKSQSREEHFSVEVLLLYDIGRW